MVCARTILPHALIAGGLLCLLSACQPECVNTLVGSQASPDTKVQAVVFERSCGATTGFSTQIALLPKGGLFSDAGSVDQGTVFVADASDGAADAVAWGGPFAEAVWLADDELAIRFDAKSRVFRTLESYAGVSITFEAVNR